MIDIPGIKHRIKELRKKRGYSVRYLADELDMSYAGVRKWENFEGWNANSIPSIDHIIELCEILDTTPNYILLGKE